MTRLSYRISKGIRPIVAPHLIDKNTAQVAENVNLESGEIRPWDNELFKESLNERNEDVLSIYYYLSTYWFEFNATVDIVESPVTGDTAFRRYYTGEAIPKKTNLSEATTGSGTYPINWFPMQVPAPIVAPTAGAPGAGGTGDARDVSYIWTVKTSWGEEGQPSDPSNIVAPTQGQAVALSAMTLVWQSGTAYVLDSWVVPTALDDHVYKCVTAGTSGGAEPHFGTCTTIGNTITDGTVTWMCVEKGILFDSGAVKTIYRANTGTTGFVWSLLATISMAATTYSDTITDDNLEATVLPSSDWNAPLDTLINLVSISGGFNAGSVGKDIYFSEPYFPHTFPDKYRISLPYTVIALASIGNTLVALTDGHPYIIYGTHPDSMTPKRLADPRACSSKTGVVNFPGGILYPSEFGYEWIDGTKRQSITKEFFTKKEWANYYPGTIKAAFQNDKLFVFYSYGGNEGGLVINFNKGIISTLDFTTTALYVDPATEKLYYLKQETEKRLLEDGSFRLTEAGDYRLLE